MVVARAGYSGVVVCTALRSSALSAVQAAGVMLANGQVQSWEPQPYAALDLTGSFFNPEIDLANYKFELAGAAAYDRERGLLYIIERLADGYKSIVHVWRLR